MCGRGDSAVTNKSASAYVPRVAHPLPQHLLTEAKAHVERMIEEASSP